MASARVGARERNADVVRVRAFRVDGGVVMPRCARARERGARRDAEGRLTRTERAGARGARDCGGASRV